MATFDRQRAIENLIQRVAGLFNNSSSDPDVTILCNGQQWLCHKAILRASSEWFSTAFSSGFKESSAKTITLEEDEEDTSAIEAMLEYTYTVDYPESADPLIHARVSALARKYFVAGLPELAESRFAKTVSEASPSELINSIKHVYLYSDDPKGILKKEILSHVLENRSLLSGANKEFKDLMLDIPEFAVAINEALVKLIGIKEDKESPAYMKKYTCPCADTQCRRVFMKAIRKNEVFKWLGCAMGHHYALTGKDWERHTIA